ncbi:MAG: hypothetical protein U0I48_07810 [Acutalibacteraceae bacterium]|nr:hypothetical protein [Acutalibacteraceae bacterium]
MGTAAPAVNWPTAMRPQCGGKHGCGQEETGSNAKRPKRAGRPLFLTDLVVGASPTWGLSAKKTVRWTVFSEERHSRYHAGGGVAVADF